MPPIKVRVKRKQGIKQFHVRCKKQLIERQKAKCNLIKCIIHVTKMMITSDFLHDNIFCTNAL